MCQAVPRTHHRCQTEQAKHPVRGTEEPAGPGGSGREGRCPGPKQAPRATAGRPRPSSHRRDCKDGANYANGPEPAHSKAPRWAEGPGWRSRLPALLPSAPRSQVDTDAPRTRSPHLCPFGALLFPRRQPRLEPGQPHPSHSCTCSPRAPSHPIIPEGGGRVDNAPNEPQVCTSSQVRG